VPDYDVAIVGAGPVGAILAGQLAQAGARVLVLEAGVAAGRTWPEYQASVEQYQAAGIKVPNTPYYSTQEAPSPNVLDIRKLTPGTLPADTGYFVQDGPLPFGTDYLRSLGGTMMHWLGTCLRMVPADFEIASRYRQGTDWPIGYEELIPYYAAAELELGVSANVEDQAYLGIEFPADYVFPMRRIPLSYLDQVVAKAVDGRTVTLDGAHHQLQVTSTPQARNSMPNPSYNGGEGYQPVGAYGAPHEGLRCEGNSSCIPICPVQAKYNPLKSWGRIEALKAAGELKGDVEMRTQCVVSRVIHSGKGPIEALEYIAYDEGQTPDPPERITASIYVLACNSIENAKLMLASDVPNGNDLIGRNLMDHPYVLAWGLMPESVGAYRGPSSTAGIEILRDGGFRSQRAAFRMEVRGWGWDFATNSPYSDVEALVGDGLFGRELRERLAERVSRQFAFGFLFEQLPRATNRVYVDDSYLDPLGIPRPRFQYDIDDYTRAGMASARQLWTQLFAHLGASDNTSYSEADPGYITYRGEPYLYIGAGHNVGTHLMGNDAAKSVVDSYQRCWEHENLYLAGCGSFPTIATSNPSLTMAALAFRTSGEMKRDLGLQ